MIYSKRSFAINPIFKSIILQTLIISTQMSDQLQFVAFDFLQHQHQPQNHDILETPELSQLHSTSSYSSMELQDSSTRQIFIQDSTATQDSHTYERPPKNQSKSVLHNMQKHFFTFVQYLTPKTSFLIQNLQGSNVEVLKCSKELVKLIKNQKRKTREELVPIFGEFDEKRISRANSIYSGLAQKYSVSILKQSLAQLKEHYLSAIKSQHVLENYTQNSKMGRKAQFKKYIESFIVEVETNKFKLRLTKESQESIRNLEINEKKGPEDWQKFFS